MLHGKSSLPVALLRSVGIYSVYMFHPDAQSLIVNQRELATLPKVRQSIKVKCYMFG